MIHTHTHTLGCIRVTYRCRMKHTIHLFIVRGGERCSRERCQGRVKGENNVQTCKGRTSSKGRTQKWFAHTHTRCVNFLRVPFRCLSRTLELKCSFIFLYLSICFVWHRTQGDFSSRSQERWGGGILWEVRDRVRIFGIIYAVTWYLCTFENVFYLTVDLLSAPRSRASFFFFFESVGRSLFCFSLA